MKRSLRHGLLALILSVGLSAQSLTFTGNTAVSDAALRETIVPVELSAGQYVPIENPAPGEGIAAANLRLGKMSNAAFVTLLQAFSKTYQDSDIYATRAVIAGNDFQTFLNGGSLLVRIQEGTVQKVDVVAAEKEKPLWIGTKERVSDVIAMAPGDLVDMNRIEEGLNLLNRHPRRYIEPYLRADEGQLALEYRVRELSQLSASMIFDTFGTTSGGETRLSIGADYYNAAGLDDKISMRFVADARSLTDLELNVWALSLGYDLPLNSAGTQKLSFSTSFSEYDSAQLGIQGFGVGFGGQTLSLGVDYTHNIFQDDLTFIDAFAGLRYMNVNVDRSSAGVPETDSSFLLVSAGLSASSLGRDQWWSLSGRIEGNLSALGNTVDSPALNNLGRFAADDDFIYLALNGYYGAYIDELLGKEGRRAHELTLVANAFASLTGDRLPATFLTVAGGGNHVRGYPTAVTSGDYGLFASATHTIHLPRLLQTSTTLLDDAGQSFRQRPRFAGDFTDWDLALKFFIDAAYIAKADRLSFEENDFLLSTGFGLGWSYRNVYNAELIFGLPLAEVDTGIETIEPGDLRIDASFSFKW